ncbi:MAG: hypothetical protein ACKVP2_16615 [Burkholderiales bacterium]
MPGQSPLRLIKRWRRYQKRGDWTGVPNGTRGIYVLYQSKGTKKHEVVYIGVAGLSKTGRGGIKGRLRSHNRNKKGWTHYSFFEVHDNIFTEEIRELEALLLGIFRHDPRIKLLNMQTGSKKLYKLQGAGVWKTQ